MRGHYYGEVWDKLVEHVADGKTYDKMAERRPDDWQEQIADEIDAMSNGELIMLLAEAGLIGGGE